MQRIFLNSIPPKKVLNLTGIELESPQLPVGRADHSAIRPFHFHIFIYLVYRLNLKTN